MGHSEWFLSCHRLRADVKRNGLQEEPKRRRNKVKIEINDNEDMDMLEDYEEI